MNAVLLQSNDQSSTEATPQKDKISLYNEIEGLYFMLKLNRRKIMKLHRTIEHGKIRRLNIIQNELLEHEKRNHQLENNCTQ